MDSEKIIISVSEILPGLWLGNEAASQNIDFIKSKNIEIIINCTSEISFISNNLPNSKQLKKYRINLDNPGPVCANKSKCEDNNIYKMAMSLPIITDIIHYWYSKNKNILIHCHSGVQRSAAVMAAYLMRFKDMDYNNSINYILKKRNIVFYSGTYVNFEKALLIFQSSSYCRRSSYASPIASGE